MRILRGALACAARRGFRLEMAAAGRRPSVQPAEFAADAKVVDAPMAHEHFGRAVLDDLAALQDDAAFLAWGWRVPFLLSVVLVAFVLMIYRRDVASQAIGLFSLENGISLAALVVAASLPLILEVALLFDLLLAVVVFGLLSRMHHGRARSRLPQRRRVYSALQ